jgi:hypothetical protein
VIACREITLETYIFREHDGSLRVVKCVMGPDERIEDAELYLTSNGYAVVLKEPVKVTEWENYMGEQKIKARYTVRNMPVGLWLIDYVDSVNPDGTLNAVVMNRRRTLIIDSITGTASPVVVMETVQPSQVVSQVISAYNGLKQVGRFREEYLPILVMDFGDKIVVEYLYGDIMALQTGRIVIRPYTGNVEMRSLQGSVTAICAWDWFGPPDGYHDVFKDQLIVNHVMTLDDDGRTVWRLDGVYRLLYSCHYLMAKYGIVLPNGYEFVNFLPLNVGGQPVALVLVRTRRRTRVLRRQGG